jgi:hypothetical protein
MHKISVKTQFNGVKKIFLLYWENYGGFRAIFSSTYFLFSVIMCFLCVGLWIREGWWTLPLSIMPNLISFTLAGFALFMAVGDEKFKRLLADTARSKGPLMTISASFVHFIFIQALSILLALIASSRPYSLIFSIIDINNLPGHVILVLKVLKFAAWGFGFLIFLYAISSVVSLSLGLFRIIYWFNGFAKREADR